jgi:hypothetical protein
VSSVMCMLNIATKLNIQHLMKLFHSSKGRVIIDDQIYYTCNVSPLKDM